MTFAPLTAGRLFWQCNSGWLGRAWGFAGLLTEPLQATQN